MTKKSLTLPSFYAPLGTLKVLRGLSPASLPILAVKGGFVFLGRIIAPDVPGTREGLGGLLRAVSTRRALFFAQNSKSKEVLS